MKNNDGFSSREDAEVRDCEAYASSVPGCVLVTWHSAKHPAGPSRQMPNAQLYSRDGTKNGGAFFLSPERRCGSSQCRRATPKWEVEKVGYPVGRTFTLGPVSLAGFLAAPDGQRQVLSLIDDADGKVFLVGHALFVRLTTKPGLFLPSDDKICVVIRCDDQAGMVIDRRLAVSLEKLSPSICLTRHAH